MSFLGEIKRRKVFQVAAVYAVVAWLLVQIVATVEEPLGLPTWFDTGVIVLLLVGFPIAVVLSWAFELTPEGIKSSVHVPRPETSVHATGQRLTYLTHALVLAAVGFLVVDQYVLQPRSNSLAESSTSAAPGPRPVTRFDFVLPDQLVPRLSGRPVLAVSPDGDSIIVNSAGIFLRTLDDLEPRMIPGTELTATAIMFSPDGDSIAYFSPVEQQLMRVSAQGGDPVLLAEGVSNPFGATWAFDQMILFSQPDGIYRVPANGGIPERLIETSEEIAYGPQLLPDGDSLLFAVTPASAILRDWDDSQIVVHSLSSGERTVLIEGGNDARYLPTGHLVFALGDQLLGIAFDLDTLTVSGDPVPLIQDLQRATANQTGVAHYSVSANGTLVYIKNSLSTFSRSLVWVDRSGSEEVLAIAPSSYAYPRISPDGQRIALDDRNESEDLWVWDILRETRTRLSIDEQGGVYPVWTPDSSHVAYSTSDPDSGIYWRLANNAGASELLASDVSRIGNALTPSPYFFTPTADRVVFRSDNNATGEDIGIVAVDGQSPPQWLLEGPYDERNAELSPDGRWMAYQSNESGEFEIYIRPFPNVEEGRKQVSNAGGFKPLWSRDGRELFYIEGESPARLIRVLIETDGTNFAIGARMPLMDWPYDSSYDGRTYDISPDGQRFLALKENSNTVDDWIVVVQNWFEELRSRVPTE
ncbi:MAG: hypothetical protein O6765_06015 [Gammaproteobacteria bacterium]|nr:hypothetical protein [Gammaproteobacteria bacterium]